MKRKKQIELRKDYIMTTSMMLVLMVTISMTLSIDKKLRKNDGESEQ